MKSAGKDLPPTNPGFALYRALRASSSKIIRTKHHHTFLSSCLEREFTPRGLSLQKKINVIGNSTKLDILIKQHQYEAERGIMQAIVRHYSGLSIANLQELEEFERPISYNHKLILTIKCRLILDIESLLWNLAKRNTQKLTQKRRPPDIQRQTELKKRY